MHYLRLSLKGDAAQLIANLPVSSESFITAWDLLDARYENKRLLVTSQLDCFFGIPTITPKSYKSLNALINTTSAVLNALRSLEMPVDEWGTILVHFIVSRLDHHLREQWELRLGSSTEPATLPQLREFLTTRARALESIDIGKASSPRPTSLGTSNTPQKRSSSSVKAFTSQTTNPQANQVDGRSRNIDTAAAVAATAPLNPAGNATQCCYFCLGSHFITKCGLFKQKSPQERRLVAEQRRLCFNCLGPHSAANCRVTGRCFECNGKHHTMIYLPSSTQPAALTLWQSTSKDTSSNRPPTSEPVATSSPNEPQA